MGLGHHKLAFHRASIDVPTFRLREQEEEEYNAAALTSADDYLSPYEDKSRSVFHRIESSRFLQTFLRYPAPDSLKLKPTSWLDGVRGVAALEVYVFHTISCWRTIFPAFGAQSDQMSLIQLPVIRSFFVTGGTAVCVFFVLSGYVLTYKSLRWMRAGTPQHVYPSVASSMFRRGFRLYLPPILLTFVEMLVTRLGYSPPLNFDFVPEATFGAALLDWLKETCYLVNPYYNFVPAIQGFVIHPKYDPVIWTIPLEFYGSFTVYILLLLVARLPRHGARMALVALFAVAAMFLGSWNAFCFAAGMLLADYNLAQEADGSRPGLRPPKHRTLWIAILVAALYLAGFPTLSYEEAHRWPMPGYETLRALIPVSLNMMDHARWWWSFAGVGLLFCVSQLPALRSVFESNLCQYLGRIAFSLYLVHQLCVIVFGLWLQNALLWLFGVPTHSMTWLYWAISLLWYVPFTTVVFAFAALVERFVDQGSVRFARWLESKCLELYRTLTARRKGMYRPL
ncbi:acyltransferase [Drepanopeziza brunnea f. sp. 'multigermtubi' MB_m1]|uniref:Acyltransferase n=1 Tax=Marssonina brunnea f. sp. multigermtubi (strain MB_m1) TaxID=1072389 RepID=K1WT09_MARBU|nr:acyltransferase [Drepanopeziza brunnea f. sp. 'multigermtubi' MB_m1]EKD16176.1 acyltransferase [Drepanopeziza brunnea f. sp. 'multigermtubi' MB_m1]